jgi:preprotein translocase YajC subunit
MIFDYVGKAYGSAPQGERRACSVSSAAAGHIAWARLAGRSREGETSLLFDFSISILFAQEEGAAPNSIVQAMPLITIVAIFFLYIMLVQRPGMKRERESRESMLTGLKKNDRIVTTGGIYGVVTNVQLDADEVTIRVDETTNTKIKITRSAVQRVVGGEAGGKETA